MIPKHIVNVDIELQAYRYYNVPLLIYILIDQFKRQHNYTID